MAKKKGESILGPGLQIAKPPKGTYNFGPHKRNEKKVGIILARLRERF